MSSASCLCMLCSSNFKETTESTAEGLVENGRKQLCWCPRLRHLAHSQVLAMTLDTSDLISWRVRDLTDSDPKLPDFRRFAGCCGIESVLLPGKTSSSLRASMGGSTSTSIALHGRQTSVLHNIKLRLNASWVHC